MIVDQLFTTYTVVGNTKQFFSESRHNKMLKEDVTYRKFHNLSRMLAERKMSEKEILQVFADAEAGMTDKVRIITGDIFQEDFSSATVVTLYLMPHLNLKLRPTLL